MAACCSTVSRHLHVAIPAIHHRDHGVSTRIRSPRAVRLPSHELDIESSYSSIKLQHRQRSRDHSAFPLPWLIPISTLSWLGRRRHSNAHSW